MQMLKMIEIYKGFAISYYSKTKNNIIVDCGHYSIGKVEEEE